MSPKGARMRSRRYLLAACTLLAVGTLSTPSQASSSANWPQFRLTPDHTGYNASSQDAKGYAISAATGFIVWAVGPGGPGPGGFQASLNVVGNLVYIGSLDSRLYALSTTTGSPAWSTKTGGPIHSSPAVSNGD